MTAELTGQYASIMKGEGVEVSNSFQSKLGRVCHTVKLWENFHMNILIFGRTMTRCIKSFLDTSCQVLFREDDYVSIAKHCEPESCLAEPPMVFDSFLAPLPSRKSTICGLIILSRTLLICPVRATGQ